MVSKIIRYFRYNSIKSRYSIAVRTIFTYIIHAEFGFSMDILVKDTPGNTV